MTKTYTIIGTMSGTAMDGVDVALLTTDGERVLRPGPTGFYPYAPAFRQELRGILGGADMARIAPVEQELTRLHIDALRDFIKKHHLDSGGVDYIALHGHTILHDPKNRHTWQIGDGPDLAKALGIPVIHDFRTADVMAGGHGAPLVPVFHAALARDLPKPAMMVNIGGVANVTYIGADGALLAFDTGPGNALLDDWLLQHTGRAMDVDGAIAQSGQVQESLVQQWLADAFFQKPPPKSLDRQAWSRLLSQITSLSLADGAATLAAFTARAIAQSARHLPATAHAWIICGGGRHNHAVMAHLRNLLPGVRRVDDLGWDGDFIEAWAFAYLAARHLRGLPISFPQTTGVPRPISGGRLAQPVPQTLDRT